MGGFARALAGGLAGLGRGMAAKGAADLQQRYAEAMENLRAQNTSTQTREASQLRREETGEQYGHMADNAERQAKIEEGSAMRINEQQAGIRAKEQGASVTAEQQRQESDLTFRERQQQADRAHDLTVLRLRQAGDAASLRLANELDTSRDAASHAAQAEREANRPRPATSSRGSLYEALDASPAETGAQPAPPAADYRWDPETRQMVPIR